MSNKNGRRIPKELFSFDFPGDPSLAIPTLARLRESAEKRVRQQRRGLVVTHCHHYILRRRSREAPAANRRHYRDATKLVLPDLTFQSESCVNIIKV